VEIHPHCRYSWHRSKLDDVGDPLPHNTCWLPRRTHRSWAHHRPKTPVLDDGLWQFATSLALRHMISKSGRVKWNWDPKKFQRLVLLSTRCNLVGRHQLSHPSPKWQIGTIPGGQRVPNRRRTQHLDRVCDSKYRQWSKRRYWQRQRTLGHSNTFRCETQSNGLCVSSKGENFNSHNWLPVVATTPIDLIICCYCTQTLSLVWLISMIAETMPVSFSSTWKAKEKRWNASSTTHSIA
jgi:hypothetical protein